VGDGVDFDADGELVFEGEEFVAALVLDGVGDLGVEADGGAVDRARDSALFDAAQEAQADHFGAGDAPAAAAGGASAVGAELEGLFDALAVDFEEAVFADGTDLDAGFVVFDGIAEGFFDDAAVLVEAHVDEVDDDQAADVAQAKLAGDLFGGLIVGFEGGLFVGGGLCGAARVDVDGGEGFGAVDDDVSARGEADFAAVDALDLFFEAEAGEEGHAVGVVEELHAGAGHAGADVALGFFEELLIVDDDLFDGGVEVIAQSLNDEVLVGVDLAGGAGALCVGGFVLDATPEAGEGGEVALEGELGLVDGVGAHDAAEAVGDLEAGEALLDVAALVFVGFAGDAAGVVEGHEDEVAASEGDAGGEDSALGANGVFDDLDEEALAALDDLFNAGEAGAFGGRVAEDAGDDVVDGEETLARTAEVDECGVEAGLDAGDDAHVDVAAAETRLCGFDLVVFKDIIGDDGDAQFFAALAIDKHASGQGRSPCVWSRGRLGGSRRRGSVRGGVQRVLDGDRDLGVPCAKDVWGTCWG
jgi:hypothetical protein